MSARLMALLGQFTPHVEVYSIDEAFLRVSGTPAELAAMGREIRRRVAHDLGLPVSVGIGPSRTLAKTFCHGAKDHPVLAGVGSTDLYSPTQIDAILDSIPAAEVWGIGRRLAERLGGLGIHTALQLRDADPKAMRRKFSVMVERTVRELGGTDCVTITDRDAARTGQVMFSRSFSTPVTSTDQMHQVLALTWRRATPDTVVTGRQVRHCIGKTLRPHHTVPTDGHGPVNLGHIGVAVREPPPGGLTNTRSPTSPASAEKVVFRLSSGHGVVLTSGSHRWGSPVATA
nr:hypothetical protein [Propionibacterium freudenreichii]